MRFMIIVKATKDTEADKMPGCTLVHLRPPYAGLKETHVGSKAKTIGSTDPTQPGTAVEERERLLQLHGGYRHV
jgi:hypothetical protein